MVSHYFQRRRPFAMGVATSVSRSYISGYYRGNLPIGRRFGRCHTTYHAKQTVPRTRGVPQWRPHQRCIQRWTVAYSLTFDANTIATEPKEGRKYSSRHEPVLPRGYVYYDGRRVRRAQPVKTSTILDTLSGPSSLLPAYFSLSFSYS